ncbi:MAG: carbohydrate kinase family protein [Promethearchaeota archaeon]
MTEIFDVICIGAALVDMIAQVERHPESDDEVFVSDLKILSGGAAANTAYACAKIGLKSVFIGKLGKNDTMGLKIINDFNNVHVNTNFIKYSEEYGTGTAYIALNKEGDRRIYAHSGAANYLSKDDIIEGELMPTKILFLSSLKNLQPFIEASKIGKSNMIPVILNPGMLIVEQGFSLIKELLKNVDVLIMSEREFRILLNIEGEKLTLDIVKANSQILFDLEIKSLIITIGQKGAFLATANTSNLISPFNVENVVDTTGAGDAFSAGFIYGFIQNPSFEFEDLCYNVKIGNLLASKCIQKLGARNGIPDAEAFKRELGNI